MAFLEFRNAFCLWHGDLGNESQALISREAVGFADSLEKAFRLTTVCEYIRAEGECPNEIKRVTVGACVSRALIAQPDGLIGESQHPEQLARVHFDEGTQIVPGPLYPFLGTPRLVQRQRPVSLLTRFNQPSIQKMMDHRGRMAEHSQIDIAGLAAGREHAIHPLQRIGNAALGDGTGPYPPHRQQPAFGIPLAFGETKDSSRILSNLWSRPSPQSRPGGV